MTLQIYLIFLLLTLVSSLFKEKCQETQCLGHYVLTHSRELHVNLTSVKFTGEIKVYPKLMDAMVFSRDRYTSYCYQGGNLDANTGCDVTETQLWPSLEELGEWDQNEGCTIGNVCCPHGDCWGTGANECLDPYRGKLIRNYYTNKEFSCSHSNWLVFPHHSCVIDWKCQFQRIHLPLHVCPVRGSMRVCTSAPNGTELIVPSDLGAPYQVWSIDKYSKMAVSMKAIFSLRPIVTNCKMECFKRLRNDVMPELCILSGECGLGKEVLRLIQGTEWLCSRYICLDGRSIRPGSQSGIPYLHETEPPPEITSNTGKGPDEMASKEDLTVVMNYVAAEIVRIDMNTVNLTEHVSQIEKRLINLVNYLSQSDKLLFGKVMERSVLVKYMDNNQFTVCPCTLESIPESKICEPNGFQFRLGSVWDWDGTSECLKPAKNTTHVQLISDSRFIQDDYKEPDIVGASFEWDGWQFVGRYRDSLVDTMNTNYGFKNSILFPNINSNLFNPIALFSSFISSYISWIALGLSIFNFCRR